MPSTTATNEALHPSPSSFSPSLPVSTTTTTTYGKFHYIPAGHTPIPSPHNFHLPAMSSFSDTRILPLHDLRPLPTLSQHLLLPGAEDDVPSRAQLSTHNFTALHYPSVMHSAPYSYTSWKDPHLLRQIYVPETEVLVKQITGAKRVVTESLLLRSVLWTEEDALATHAGHGNDQLEKRNVEQQQQQQQQEQQEQEQDSANRHHLPPLPPPQDSVSDHPVISASSPSFPQFISFSPFPNSSGGASPAPKPHQDYTPRGARAHIQHYHPSLTAAASSIIAAEDVNAANTNSCAPPLPRWALFSIWRPLRPVKRDALALGDARTFRDEDYVPVVIRTPSLGRRCEGGEEEVHECEAWVARGAQAQAQEHRWWWVSGQRPEEVLVIGLFDSGREGEEMQGKAAMGGAMHSSVELVKGKGEGAGEGTEEEPRESLEVRCLAIW